MRIAAKLSLKIFVSWPLNQECRCSFSELFENSLPEIDAVDYYRKTKSSTKCINEFEWLVDYNKFKGNSVINISSRFLLFPEDKISRRHVLAFLSGGDGKGIDFKYHDIPPILKKDFLYYVNSLIPKKAIIGKVDEFAQQFDDDTVSVQLRTWKYILGSRDYRRSELFNIKSAYNIIDLNSEKKIFVSCDSEEILKELQKEYGSRILHNPEDHFEQSRDSTQGIQVAFVNLLLFAKNKKIIASPQNTCSEMAWWFSGCQAEVESMPIPFFNYFLFAYRKFLNWLRRFTDYYLMLRHDLGVRLRPKIKNFPVSEPSSRKIHFFYCTCGRDFQYLTISLKSLELLHLDQLGKIYICVDKEDNFSSNQIRELNDNFPSLEIRFSCRPLSWGGVKLLLSELASFEEMIHEIPPDDYICKVDSDVLFISEKIFKKVLSENYDAVGQEIPGGLMEGGSYFLKSSFVRNIVRSPILKAVRSFLPRHPINLLPEDRIMNKLVEQSKGNVLLCEYRLHGIKFRKLVKWSDLDSYSVIHFSHHAGIRREFMVKVWELLKNKEFFE
jgi:hypothetical protein